jgi:hypothetical protein
MRLIDADAVLKDLDDLKKSPWYHFDNPFVRQGMRECMEVVEEACIKDAPTVDALPYDYILNIEEELRKKANESESQERKEFYFQNAEAIQRLLVTWEMKGRGTVRGYDQTD